METLFYFSVLTNLILIWLLVQKRKAPEQAKDKKIKCNETPQAPAPKPRPIVNAQLRTIAEACEAKLPEEHRGKVKLLVHEKNTTQVAALQIGELKINLWRNGKNQSLFKIRSFMEALQLANRGYCVDGGNTERYIPVPWEVDFVLSQQHIINVYLEALKLEQISVEENFWCVDTQTGYNTGWKRFNGSVAVAFEKLHKQSRIRTSDGYFLHQVEHEENINLFLLLKGWEYMFVEV